MVRGQRLYHRGGERLSPLGWSWLGSGRGNRRLPGIKQEPHTAREGGEEG